MRFTEKVCEAPPLLPYRRVILQQAWEMHTKQNTAEIL